MAGKERLSPREEIYVREYLLDGNGARAARAAGYSPASADVRSSRLLRRARVRQAIDAGRQKKRETDGEAHAEHVERWLTEVRRIAYQDAGALYGADGLPLPVPQLQEDARRAVAGVEMSVAQGDGGQLDDGAPKPAQARVTKLKAWDKVKALELLGKHYGVLVERQRVEGADGGPLVIEIREEKA